MKSVLSIAAVTAVLYYLPHYILQLFIVYLENDPSRSDPAWGWLLAFSLFIANASVFIITGIDWSITTTYLQGRIHVQLNSMLFAKTLRKKDVAGGGAEKKDPSEKKDTQKKDAKKEGNDDEGEEEEEGVTSKSQIMVSRCVLRSRMSARRPLIWCSESIHGGCRPSQRVCISR